jgi:hypothetical protein
MIYQIKRGTDQLVADIKPTGQQAKKIMGDNSVKMSFALPYYLELLINDYCDIFGERYLINAPAEPVKSNDQPKYKYSLNLEAIQSRLKRADYKTVDQDGVYTISEFTIMCNAQMATNLLVENANRIMENWQVGIVDETDYQEITFTNQSCLEVLSTIAQAFKLEYWVEGQTIHMTKRGVIEQLKFKYGQGNGLYSISRTNDTSKPLITRLYAYGSNQNLPANYKGYSDRLKLPGTAAYIENNVYINNDPAQGMLYGIIENSQNFDDIYPHRNGLITQVGDNNRTFTDSDIDFNVNDYLLEATPAKVVFKTGDLAGYEFTISSFNNTTKTFVINPYTDGKDYTVPNETFVPAVGDQYAIVDIFMPQSYIDAAEQELQDAAEEYLLENSTPNVNYAVSCDIKYFSQNNIELHLGNYIGIADTEYGIDNNFRIVAFTRDLQQPSKYTVEVTLSTDLMPTVLKRELAAEAQKKQIERIQRGTSSAYNTALQAKATSDAFKNIITYWGVYIDEEAGLIATGTLLVGSDTLNNAGITGVTENGDQSVRFWAGATYLERNNAVFRVLNNGELFASRVKLGYGYVGSTNAGWDVTPGGILSDFKQDNPENFALIRGTSYRKEFSFGTELVPSSAGGQYSQVGRILNLRAETSDLFPTTNTGLSIEVSGANFNYALDIRAGAVRFDNSSISVDGKAMPPITDIQYRATDNTFRKATFVNGLFWKDEAL